MTSVLPEGFFGEVVSIGPLIPFTIVCLSILMPRKTRPNVDCHFRCPFLQLIPIA